MNIFNKNLLIILFHIIRNVHMNQILHESRGFLLKRFKFKKRCWRFLKHVEPTKKITTKWKQPEKRHKRNTNINIQWGEKRKKWTKNINHDRLFHLTNQDKKAGTNIILQILKEKNQKWKIKQTKSFTWINRKKSFNNQISEKKSHNKTFNFKRSKIMNIKFHTPKI